MKRLIVALTLVAGLVAFGMPVAASASSARAAAPPGCGSSDFYFQATNGGEDFMIDNGGNQDITLQFTTNACFVLVNSDAPGWYFLEDNYHRCVNAVNPGGGTPVLVLSSCVFSGDSLENFSPFGHEWQNRHYGGIDGWMTSDGNAGSAVILFSGSGWATPRA